MTDLDRFKQCSAAHGAERRRWPEREHALYDRFAATPQGAAILAEAGQLDRFLDAFEPAVPDRRLAARVAALSRPGWRRLGVPAATWAASALLGFVLGFAQVRNAADNTDLAAQLLLGPTSLQEVRL